MPLGAIPHEDMPSVAIRCDLHNVGPTRPLPLPNPGLVNRPGVLNRQGFGIPARNPSVEKRILPLVRPHSGPSTELKTGLELILVQRHRNCAVETDRPSRYVGLVIKRATVHIGILGRVGSPFPWLGLLSSEHGFESLRRCLVSRLDEVRVDP